MKIADSQCRAQGLRYDVVDARCVELGSFNRTSNGLLQREKLTQMDAERKAYEASMAAEKAATAKRAAEGYRQRKAIEAARRAKARA